jgi:hypothetical protein
MSVVRLGLGRGLDANYGRSTGHGLIGLGPHRVQEKSCDDQHRRTVGFDAGDPAGEEGQVGRRQSAESRNGKQRGAENAGILEMPIRKE